ncbi:MAG: 50S ribosomal protein L21 [Alphaproteobacteria bacterium]|jgi:large subunit ribosomal protein L21|nr:50S ribosomal protein L21 [Alphaproteobacteria bacterium]MCV6599718.1 50S ribosomal protein L21 [Alphaproteobacteria bacterium]
MFAVVKTGGKQYKVAVGDIFETEKLEAEEGKTVSLDQVLMITDGDDVVVGAPLVEGAVVKAEVVAQKRNKKILVFKKRRRQKSRVKNGHRQNVTVLKVTEIKKK